MSVSQGLHQSISFLNYYRISGPIICATHPNRGSHSKHDSTPLSSYTSCAIHEYEYASCSVSQGQDSKHLHNKQEVQRTTRSLKRWNTFFGRAWNTSYPCKVCCWTVGFILNVGPFLAVKRQESSLPRSQKRWFSDSLQIQMLHFGWQKPCWA